MQKPMRTDAHVAFPAFADLSRVFSSRSNWFTTQLGAAGEGFIVTWSVFVAFISTFSKC